MNSYLGHGVLRWRKAEVTATPARQFNGITYKRRLNAPA